ncbi:MAG: AAA family ATPase [Solirubrobacteraceae bacterium]
MVAGANGAGKSTYTAYLREHGASIIDPDVLARQSATTRLSAGRAAVRLARERMAAGETFGIETTLAGQGALRLIRLARSRNFGVDLVYLGTDNVEINLERIAERVAAGGHNVAEVDVRRRYTRSLSHLPIALALVDGFVLIDNSEDLSFTVFAERDESGTRVYSRVPAWARGLQLA